MLCISRGVHDREIGVSGCWPPESHALFPAASLPWSSAAVLSSQALNVATAFTRLGRAIEGSTMK
jgi:hypothetical protein